MPRFNLSATELLPTGLRFHLEAGCLLAPPDRIKPDPHQPRKTFEREDLLRLKRDIAKWRSAGRGVAGTGFLQPAMCTWAPGSFSAGKVRDGATLIIAEGEKRWRTNWTDADPETGELDWQWFPIVLDDLNARERYEVAVRSQYHRGDLLPLEEAHAFQHLRRTRNLSVNRLAAEFNIDASYIENRERLLKLGEDVQEMTNQRPDTISSARVIDKVKNELVRKRLIRDAVRGATAEEIASRAEPYIARDPKPAATPARMPRIDVPGYFENALRNISEINAALAAVDMPKTYYRSNVNPYLKRLRGLLDDIEGNQ